MTTSKKTTTKTTKNPKSPKKGNSLEDDNNGNDTNDNDNKDMDEDFVPPNNSPGNNSSNKNNNPVVNIVPVAAATANKDILDNNAMNGVAEVIDTEINSNAHNNNNNLLPSPIKNTPSPQQIWTATSKELKPKRALTTTVKTEDLLVQYLAHNSQNNNGLAEVRQREVEAREQEAYACLLEAKALAAKTKTENWILCIKASATLLQECKQLANKGISQEDIDALLPLGNK